MLIRKNYFKGKETPNPRTEKQRENLEQSQKQKEEARDKPDWWYDDVGKEIRKKERTQQLSEEKRNLLLKRAVLMSEIGCSFEDLSELTPKEQDDLIEGWNILQEEKEEAVDEPDI